MCFFHKAMILFDLHFLLKYNFCEFSYKLKIFLINLRKGMLNLINKHIVIIASAFLAASCLYLLHINNGTVVINHSFGVGDYWLARDLAKVISNQGDNVSIYENGKDKPVVQNADYNIVIRGNLSGIEHAVVGKKNILWLAWSNLKINNKERTIPVDEYVLKILDSVRQYDTLAIGSEKLYHLLRDRVQIPLYFVPQFTNTEKFYPDFDEKLSSEILFVGNYHFDRKAARTALENNYPIQIYGDYWPKGVARAKYIDNRILRKYYSSAKIVLNDTKENMKDFGFISNRIFDASACKAFIISDYMPEIEELYGDSVPMYKNKEELLALLDYYLSHPEERLKKADKAYNITMKYRTQNQARQYWKNILQ